jgi:hypothetical protein
MVDSNDKDGVRMESVISWNFHEWRALSVEKESQVYQTQLQSEDLKFGDSVSNS